MTQLRLALRFMFLTLWGWWSDAEDCTKALRVHYSDTVRVDGDRCVEACTASGLNPDEINDDLKQICHLKPCLVYFQRSVDLYPDICPHIANYTKADRQKNLNTCIDAYDKWNGANHVSWHHPLILYGILLGWSVIALFDICPSPSWV